MRGATRHDAAFRMSREGFTLLAMGFYRQRGAALEAGLYRRLNRMEVELQKPAQDPQHTQLAQSQATQAAAQVTQSVFDATMAADNAVWLCLKSCLRSSCAWLRHCH